MIREAFLSASALDTDCIFLVLTAAFFVAAVSISSLQERVKKLEKKLDKLVGKED